MISNSDKKEPCAGKKDGPIIFEQIHSSGTEQYAVSWLDHIECKIEIRDSLGHYKPVPKDQILWPNFGSPLECDPKEVYRDIRELLTVYVYLPFPFLYDITTAFIMASYFPEAFDFATYLILLGPIKSGKTRLLQVLELLCYRGFKTDSISPAAISRLIENYRLTLLMDETDKIAAEYKSDTIGILNAGQKKPSRYVRAEREGSGIEIRDVWGFKVLAGTEKFVRSMSSRGITYPMRKCSRRMPKLNRETEKSAINLRSKLLYLRLKWCVKEDFNDEFLKDDRLSEVFEPLFRVSPSDEATEAIKNYALKVEGLETEEDQSSVEARALKAIFDAINNGKTESGKIRTSDLTDFFNEDLSERDRISADSIGRIFSRLGFELTKVGAKSQRGFRLNNELIKELAERYLGEDSYTLDKVSEESEETVSIKPDDSLNNSLEVSVNSETDTSDTSDTIIDVKRDSDSQDQNVET